MNTERDKFLTEAMGECWDEADSNNKGFINNNNFSTWEGFGKLKEFMGNHPRFLWFRDFLEEEDESWWYMMYPDRFADAVYKYLKENNNE